MNLHGLVRGAINAVNPDIAATWRQNTGYTTAADFSRAPVYADVPVSVQVQKLTGRDLRHEAFQNLNAVARAVYMFGNGQSVVRADKKGGDLLLFPQAVGRPVQAWMVVAVLETWAPDVAGWCKLGVVLQDVAP